MKWTTLLCLAIAGCADSTAQPRFIEEEQIRSDVACRALGIDSTAITDLVTISNSTFAALAGEDRVLTVYDTSLQPITRLQFEKEGPRGVLSPVSVAFADSLIYIADDGRAAIRIVDWSGDDRGTVPLKFFPRRIRAAGEMVVATPMVAGSTPDRLLFRVSSSGGVLPLGGEIARYEDFGLNTMANMVALAAFPGRVVALHELVVPFGYVIRTDTGAPFARRVAVPIPATERHRLKNVPNVRITEKNVNDLTVVAFAATENRTTGSSYYVTRTGDGRTRPYRKVVVELDSVMQLTRAFHIDVNPHHLAYLHDRGALIAVDAEDRWFECPLPS